MTSQSRQLEALNKFISLHRAALEQNPDRSTSLFNLAGGLNARFKESGRHEDLSEAILLHREALGLRPAPHSHRSASITCLAGALNTRFKQSHRLQDLDEVISLYQDGLELQPSPHPDRSISLHNLAEALFTRFCKSGCLSDLDEAISLNRDALNPLPASHPLHFICVNNLGFMLKTRFNESAQRCDLDEAILLHQHALKQFPASHPNRATSLNNLANSLKIRFDQSGRHEDLDEAVSLSRDALLLRPATHPGRPDSLESLADALSTRFDQSGQRKDLEEAISLHSEALELRPPPHPDRSISLNNVAIMLYARFNQSSRRDDLDQAISFHRDALELRPEHHRLRFTSLNNLAGTLATQFEHSGRREDLDEAIALLRSAVGLCPSPHPLRSGSLSNLANVLKIRFDQSGRAEDLEEAIRLHQDALKLRPAPHPLRSTSFNNLGLVRHAQFDQLGRSEDLNDAISLFQDALKLRLAPHPLRSISLNNFANTLVARFDQSARREDLDQAISLYREALELEQTHSDRSRHLGNLASVLARRFTHTGRREDLDEAVSVSIKSISSLVSGHPLVCSLSANLGRTLMHGYSLTHESEYLDKAMNAFRVAVCCGSAPASERLHTARLWALGAQHAQISHESALEAYHAAIELLPRVAMLGLDLQSRHQALMSSSNGLACDAAACAVRSGQYDKAVELLEAGRAVFWSQALQLRTPMTGLREVAPELENDLRCISTALEQGSLRDITRNMSDTPQKLMSMEQEAAHFQRLNNKWLTAVEKVRQLDGFQDFLRPARLSTLQVAAVNDPVVVLIASKFGNNALIITSSDVQLVPLPRLSFIEASALVQLVRTATVSGVGHALRPDIHLAPLEGLVQQMPLLSPTFQSLRHSNDARLGRMVSDTYTNPDDIFRLVLAVLWMSVVEPIVRSLNLERSDELPNLLWCPTGPFAFLPLHAAGLYHLEKTESLSDYVVSSYTPTIGALLDDMRPPTNSFKMMIVIQPEAPDQQPLPWTHNELRQIEAHVPDKESLVKLLHGSVKEVISHLPIASIAHFACHGQQNWRNPLESALSLYDDQLKVSQIMQQSIPNASLAFLSACETAMGDENLPDEVIHLGAALLFAGFHGVVATLWSIHDADGPDIADTFYEHLFASNAPRPDTTQAARALHHAVARLRSKKVSFLRWIPFVHLGR
ncbi:hypothetical protein PILCRDRAFT_821454 [Piloderma croceum F 1598]|uniref:CHAT domain-containing protein n=1 Tax=Piloderma croceum (strain F 1598) TaxID=765440 RepID=A0A0C3B553_PILCF|nr:hypothetical protein PILCRDRAFT_821454 [Piloderma croceum F 1598]